MRRTANATANGVEAQKMFEIALTTPILLIIMSSSEFRTSSTFSEKLFSHAYSLIDLMFDRIYRDGKERHRSATAGSREAEADAHLVHEPGPLVLDLHLSDLQLLLVPSDRSVERKRDHHDRHSAERRPAAQAEQTDQHINVSVTA